VRRRRLFKLVMAEVQRRIVFKRQEKEKRRYESLKNTKVPAVKDAEESVEEFDELRADVNKKQHDATVKVVSPTFNKSVGMIEQMFRSQD